MKTTVPKRLQGQIIPKRILGMGRIATKLGVTRQHLRAVLAGRRESKRLVERYHALMSSGGSQKP